jgi:hypothetical protein
MSDIVIQASLNSGEWSPKLFARVDLAKYRSGAALLENFFVDYRGGASTRPGTKYILQCYKSATAVRLITFQASFSVGYVLEFGDQYIRFFFAGAPIVETATSITSDAAGNPTVFTDAGHGYTDDNWLFIDNKYYIVDNATVNTFTLTDLAGNVITGSPFTLPVNAERIYTISSPYASADLRTIKFAQNVNELILCHPDYEPHVLTLITSTNWTLLPITFGSTATAPTGVTATPTSTLIGAGTDIYYSYVVTAIDGNAQESAPSSIGTNHALDYRTQEGTMNITWNAVAGAIAYNVYRANLSYQGSPPVGSTFGYIGTVQTPSVEFPDTNIAPDFSQTPPIARNPFEGSGVASVAVTSAGTYTSVPTVSFTGAASTIAASATVVLQVQGTPTVGSGGAGYAVGDAVSFTNGVVLIVATEAAGVITAWEPITVSGGNPGQVTSGSTPANPVVQVTTSGGGTGATANLVWGVGLVQVLNPGAGYTSIPTVTFSAGAATATATLSATSNGYPSVPGFFQQRLVLAAPTGAPQTFYMSQPGAYFNFNTSTISQADDSISGTLVSGQLNTIRAMISQPSGLLMFTDRNSWLINGGSQGSAVSPSALVANAQSFNGVSDVPLIAANFDVLYVQAKGSIVRDSTYNIYANVYTGTDISALASHLFSRYTIDEWAWAEEPFKLAWAVRSDGVALTLTFLKEQEFIGWTHSTTLGSFKSVTSVVEATPTAGDVDAIYFVVERDINGDTVQYIERLAEREFANGAEDAWCVDCGIGYSGAPATAFSGAEFLAGETVTGLADGVVIPPFTMAANGNFTLATAASKVTVGLGFTAKLKTLPLDMGDPTIQGKVKKINGVTTRVAETLGLWIGSEPADITPMKDLVVGNVSSMLTGQNSQIVTDLIDGDARTFLDPRFTVPGQYYIEQNQPLPATVLGLMSDYTIGDTGSRR